MSNITFPQIAANLGLKVVNVGGWLIGLAEQLKLNNSIVLGIISFDNVDKLTIINQDGIRYYIIPLDYKSKRNKQISSIWGEIVNDFQPQLIHLNGSEDPYALSLIKLFPNIPSVLSIQGMVSVYSRFFSIGYTFAEILKNPLLAFYLLRSESGFRLNGKIEEEIIKFTNNVIGRTDWDRIHCKSINPLIKYHFCNETLRSIFYQSDWDINSKIKYRIFISQASHTTKGFHLVLPALQKLSNEYPNLKVIVAGNKPWEKKKNIYKRLLSNYFGYGNYLRKKIVSMGLNNFIEFTGNLKAEEMAEQLKSAHVFLLDSTIENSPNSLGEAQLIGVPCVSSYVGGIPSMVEDKRSVFLFRCEEWEMMKEYISNIFDNDDIAINLSIKGKEEALKRHNPSENVESLINIYKKIIYND
jgi:glycosyltransferase involved in cell wall biosynthesis